jgi:hypothetical protein
MNMLFLAVEQTSLCHGCVLACGGERVAESTALEARLPRTDPWTLRSNTIFRSCNSTTTA